MTKKGMLISFEGMEGAGKTTQCDLLARVLMGEGKQVVVVREPGGVPIAEQIREVVLAPKNHAMGIAAEVLLFQAARAQLYEELVLPGIERGKFVLMDRTRDSSTVYQGMVREVGMERIEWLNDYATGETVPDLTFLLDLPAQLGMERRMHDGKLDRIELEGVGLQEKVCAAYLGFARADKAGRWVIVDGTKSIEEVSELVRDKLLGYLKQRNGGSGE